MRLGAILVGVVFTLPLGAAHAQQLYRWVDQHGEVHVSDQPPPPGAKSIQQKAYGDTAAATPEAPFALQKAMKDYPVTLYTSPTCQDPCSQARAALNQRGVPFKEVSVWNPETNAELKRVSGSNEVPVLVVGASIEKGFSQGAFDSALDSAGYPRAGILPARSQAAPPIPEAYVPPAQRARPPVAAQPQPEEPQKPLGPYAPR